MRSEIYDCAAVVVRAVPLATTRARRNRRDIDRASRLVAELAYSLTC